MRLVLDEWNDGRAPGRRGVDQASEQASHSLDRTAVHSPAFAVLAVATGWSAA